MPFKTIKFQYSDLSRTPQGNEADICRDLIIDIFKNNSITYYWRHSYIIAFAIL